VVEPTALQVLKRGRWCTVAKITRFEDGNAPILAVAWRNQPGMKQAISMPEVVLEYARQAGCRWFVLRDDRSRTMWCCPLSKFYLGRLYQDGEYYIPLNWLTPVPWADWIYAERVVRLQQSQSAVQPTLLEVAR